MFYSILLIILFFSLIYLGFYDFKKALFLLPVFLPSYLLRFTIFIFPSTVLELYVIALFFSFILKLIFQKGEFHKLKKFFVKYKAFLFSILFVVIFSLYSVFISVNIWQALGLWRAFILEPFILMFLLFYFFEKDDFLESLKYFIFPNFLIIIVAIYQYISLNSWLEYNGVEYIHRINSIYPYPNALSLFLAPIILFFLLFSISSFKKEKYFQSILYCLLFLFDIYLIYSAKSESALLAIVIALGIFALFWNKYSRYFIIVISVITSFLLFYFSKIQYLIYKLSLQDFSGLIRRNMYKETWNMLKTRFWEGTGLASYQELMKPFHNYELVMLDKDGNAFKQLVEIYLYPHNIILNFWVNFGFVLMLIFILAILYYISFFFREYLKTKELLYFILALSFLIIFIHGLFDVPFFKNDLAILSLYLFSFLLIFKKNKVKVH